MSERTPAQHESNRKYQRKLRAQRKAEKMQTLENISGEQLAIVKKKIKEESIIEGKTSIKKIIKKLFPQQEEKIYAHLTLEQKAEVNKSISSYFLEKAIDIIEQSFSPEKLENASIAEVTRVVSLLLEQHKILIGDGPASSVTINLSSVIKRATEDRQIEIDVTNEEEKK